MIQDYRGPPDCSTQTSTLSDCLPSGSIIDSRYASYSGSPERGAQINYLSPGLDCPNAWVTVGVAAKDPAGSLTSTNGVFSSPSTSLYNGDFLRRPRQVLFASALAPAETAVVYCPSGFKPENDACVSTIPSIKATTGCIYFILTSDYTFASTVLILLDTTAAAIFTLTATSPMADSLTTVFSPAEASNWAAVSYLPMVTLVHKSSDVPTTSPKRPIAGQTTAPSTAPGATSVPTDAAHSSHSPRFQRLFGLSLALWGVASFAVRICPYLA
jgi:hypothetical protein